MIQRSKSKTTSSSLLSSSSSSSSFPTMMVKLRTKGGVKVVHSSPSSYMSSLPRPLPRRPLYCRRSNKEKESRLEQYCSLQQLYNDKEGYDSKTKEQAKEEKKKTHIFYSSFFRHPQSVKGMNKKQNTIFISLLTISILMLTSTFTVTHNLHLKKRKALLFNYHPKKGMSLYEKLTTLNYLQKSYFETEYYQAHDNNTLFYMNERRKWFPCHYFDHREDEFLIEPFFEQNLDELLSSSSSSSSSKLKDYHIRNTLNFDTSIITIMSPKEQMFDNLLSISQRWTGPISVALFINSISERDKVHAMIRDFYHKYHNDERNERKQRMNVILHHAKDGSITTNSTVKVAKLERLCFHLVTDLNTDENNPRGNDSNVFPRNLLRNVALDYSYTSHVMILDIDFIISLNAHNNIKRHILKMHNRPNAFGKGFNKHAFVIPALEVDANFNQTLADTKRDFIETRKTENGTNLYIPFLQKGKRDAHLATDYPRWYEKSKSMYPIEGYHPDYEPYIVVRKDANLPPFWEHFTGFGRNKLEWIEEIYLTGYQFLVVPDCFIVHRMHDSYGLRRVRPFVVDEYMERFQKYIKQAYGRNIQNMRELEQWRYIAHRKWELVEKEKKTEAVSYENMNQMSIRRDAEFQKCMRILENRDYVYRTDAEIHRYNMLHFWTMIVILLLLTVFRSFICGQ